MTEYSVAKLKRCEVAFETFVWLMLHKYLTPGGPDRSPLMPIV